MTHSTITQTPAEHAAIAATHAALMTVNSVEAWAPSTHLFGDLEHVLIAMFRDTYPDRDIDAHAWLTDLHDGVTPADAEQRMLVRHGIGTVMSGDRQHWIETGEHVTHAFEVDSQDEGGPDEAHAAFCSCGWRCEWQHADTTGPNYTGSDAYDAARSEGDLHLEQVLEA